MPLPTASIDWPPKALDAISPQLDEWQAWWVGDPKDLRNLYSGNGSAPRTRPSQQRGGVVGAFARFWWGRPVTDPAQHQDHTHVPIPADIASTSADLLFSEPPDLIVDDDKTQSHLEDALADDLYSKLTGAAETSAALGGAFLRVTWDKQLRGNAFLTVMPATDAVPEFQFGQLRAVTFTTILDTVGSVVWRHLERHELDDNGFGLIQHGLFEGSMTKLGRPKPLAERPETQPLEAMVDAGGYIIDGRTPGLNVVYVPNTEPSASKAWLKTPTARGWGASDFDGLEPLFDELDEINASWMRDIRLAKARLVVARYMLDDHGPGGGASMNLDREVFAPLRMSQDEAGNDAPITPVQFAIRFAEHQASSREWTERIIRSAGYSLQTFGDHDSSQMTATEVSSRDNRSLMKRGRKLRLWRPALTAIITKLIDVDAAVFKSNLSAEGLQVRFPDGIWETPQQLAQTAQALSVAGAASVRTLVALVHPEWDEADIDKEAARILAERGQEIDPYTFTG